MRLLPVLTFLIFAFSSFSFAQSDRDKGIEMFRQGNYAEATAVLETLFASGQVDHSTALYLGASYVKTGNDKKAMEAFSKAEKLKTLKSGELKYDKKIFLTQNPKPRFSDTAMGKERSGIIRLVVEFKEDGKLGFIFPFQTTAETLIADATKTARQIRFEPAKINGKPVTVVMIMEYAFFR